MYRNARKKKLPCIHHKNNKLSVLVVTFKKSKSYHQIDTFSIC